MPQGQARSAFCPVEAVEAQVVAVDSQGRPAILEHALGAGRVAFSAYPLEYYLLQAHEAHQADETWRLYQALRELAGLHPQIDGDNPFVEVRYLEGPEGLLVWAINHSWAPQRLRLRPRFPVALARDVESGAEAPLELELPKKEVWVLQLPAT